MKLTKLNTEITLLEDICKPFLLKKEEINEKEKNIDNISLKIKAFDGIIKECKEEVNLADKEHMEHVLKLLYGLENISDADEGLDNYVTQQIDNHLFEEHYLLVELNLFVGVSEVLHVFFS